MKDKKILQRVISGVLCAVMVLGYMPAEGWAAESADTEVVDSVFSDVLPVDATPTSQQESEVFTDVLSETELNGGTIDSVFSESEEVGSGTVLEILSASAYESDESTEPQDTGWVEIEEITDKTLGTETEGQVRNINLLSTEDDGIMTTALSSTPMILVQESAEGYYTEEVRSSFKVYLPAGANLKLYRSTQKSIATVSDLIANGTVLSDETVNSETYFEVFWGYTANTCSSEIVLKLCFVISGTGFSTVYSDLLTVRVHHPNVNLVSTDGTTAYVSASDIMGPGITGYAMTTTDSAPSASDSSAWQTSNIFTGLQKMTSYWFWCKNSNVVSGYYRLDTGGLSARDDTAVRTVLDSLTSTSTTASASTMLVASASGGGGNSGAYYYYYYFSQSSATPTRGSTGWQSSNTYVASTAGTWYCWALEFNGTISSSKSITLSAAAATKPSVEGVIINKLVDGKKGEALDLQTYYAYPICVTPIAKNYHYIARSDVNLTEYLGWVTYTWYSFTIEGAYVRYWFAKDDAGNISDPYYTYFILDWTAPSVNLSATSGYTTGAVKFSWYSNDRVSGTQAYAITTSTATPTSWTNCSGGTWYDFADTITANKVYYIWAKDKAGNVGYSTYTAYYDKTAPTATVTASPSGYTNGNVTVSIKNAADNSGGSGLHATPYSWDGGSTWVATASKTFSSTQTVTVKVRDAVGNVATYTAGVYVDKTAPTATVTASPSGYTNGSVTVSITNYNDTGGGGKHATPYSWDGGSTWVATASKTFSSTQTVTVKVRDAVGNVATYTANVYVDKTAPTATISHSPTTWTNGSVTVSISGKNDTGGSGLHSTPFSFDGGTNWTAGETTTVSSNTTLTVVVRDNAGNQTSYPYTIGNIDTSKPKVETVQTGDSAGQIKVTASDTGGSGISAYYASTDSGTPTGGSWKEVAAAGSQGQASGSYTFTGLSNGTTYYIFVKDTAGNVSAASQGVSTLDVPGTPLSATFVPTIFGEHDGWTASGGTITVEMNTDPLGGQMLRYKIGDGGLSGDWVDIDGNSFIVPDDEVATRTYYIRAFNATDDSLVSTDAISVTVKIDRTKPKITMDADVKTWTNGDVVLTVTATDLLTDDTTPGSGVKGYYWTTNENDVPTKSSNWTANDTSRTVTVNNTTWYCYAIDNVGNISVAASYRVTNIDKADPTVTIVPNTTDPAQQVTMTASANDQATETSGASQVNGYYWSQDKDDGPESASDAKWSAEGFSEETLTVIEDGTYYVWVRDTAGNISDRASYKVDNIDRTGPKMKKLTADPTTWTNEPVRLTATAEDNLAGVSGYYFSQDKDTPPTAESDWQESPVRDVSANGTWYVWAIDKAGNISDSYARATVKYDAQAPTILGDITASTTGWTNEPVTLTAKAKDAPSTDKTSGTSKVAGYYFSDRDEAPDPATDEGWTMVTASLNVTCTYEVSKNGTYYLWVKDAVGNMSEKVSVEITCFDETRILQEPQDVTTYREECYTSVEFYAVDGSTITWYAADHEPNPQEYGSATFKVSSETIASAENHTKQYGFQGAGVEESCETKDMYVWCYIESPTGIRLYSRVAHLILNGPKIVDMFVTITDNGSGSGFNPHVTATDTDGHTIEYVALTTGQTPPEAGSVEWVPIGDITSKEYTILQGYCWVKNEAGYISAPYQYDVNLSAPEPTMTKFELGHTDWTNKPIPVNCEADGATRFFITNDPDVTPKATDEGWVLKGNTYVTANGTWYCWACNGIGKVSATSMEVQVENFDAKKPEVTNFYTDIEDWTGESGNLYADVEDQDDPEGLSGTSGVTHVYFSQEEEEPLVTAAEWIAVDEFGSATLEVDKGVIWYCWAKDAAGNISDPAEVEVMIDGEKPEIKEIKADPSDWTNQEISLSVEAEDVGSEEMMYYWSTSLEDGPTKDTVDDFEWEYSKTKEVEINGTWYCWVKDLAGNVSDYGEIQVRYDALMPEITDISNEGTTITVTAKDAQGNETSGQSGIAGYYIGREETVPEDADWVESAEGMYTFTDLTYGETYYVFAKDAAGNISDASESVRMTRQITVIGELSITDSAEAQYSVLNFSEKVTQDELTALADLTFTQVEVTGIALKDKDTLVENYSRYGTDSANGNLALTLLTAGDGETDLSNTTISVTGATAIKLYNAAAYNATDDRTVNVMLSTDDGDRLDLQLTIKGVESKMLVLDVPVYTNITLTPGVEYRATSDPATITNRNPYPISVSLTNIQPGEDSPKLVKSVPTDETGLLELMNAGVKVGVEIGENSHYYDPDAGASITIADILGAEAQQQFNYIMEFSPLYTGVRKEDVTYTISYLFAISAHDVATGG